jgi:hypothetical protein
MLCQKPCAYNNCEPFIFKLSEGLCKEWMAKRTNCKDEEDSWKEQSSSDGDEVKWWLIDGG